MFGLKQAQGNPLVRLFPGRIAWAKVEGRDANRLGILDVTANVSAALATRSVSLADR